MNSILNAMRSAARKHLEYRETLHEFDNMSERQLNDIGVHKADTRKAARRAVYGK